MNTIELFRLFGTIALNDREARQGLQNIDSQAENTSRKFGLLGQAGKGMAGIVAKAVAGVVTGIGAMSTVMAGINYNSMMENSKVAWKTLLGTQEEAKTMLGDIANFAKTTQFDTTQVDMMAKYMHNAGLEGQGLFDELTKVADVSGAFNIPAAEAEELTRQMSQVRQAGVAYTEDLNVLQDRGVPIYKAISEQLGITVGDVKKMASEGKLSSDIYLKAFDSIAKGVQGASADQSKTFTGMLSTLKDNLSAIAGSLMESGFEKLKGILETAMPYIERFSTTLKDEGLKAALGEIFGEEKVAKAEALFNTIKDIGLTTFNAFKDVVKFVSDNLNILLPIMAGLTAAILAQMAINTLTGLYAAWQLATTGQTTAQWLLNAALDANPIGLVALAIGALVAIGIALYKNWDTVKAKTQELWDKLGPFQGVIRALLGPFGMLIDAGVKLYKNWDTIVSKAKEVVDKVQGFFGGMKIKLPDIKTPHFKLKNWSINPLDWADKKPSIGIDWYAKGTNFAQGGLAVVGERGPELVNLPRGSKVSTANETAKMGNTFSFERMMEGATFIVREEADISKIAKELLNLTKQAARSKGTVMV